MKEAATAPATIERLAYNPLDRRTLYGALDYVLKQTGYDVMSDVDARFQIEATIGHLTSAAGGGVGQAAVAQLVEMLSQLGFNIQLPTAATASGLIDQQQQALHALSPGATGDALPVGSFGPTDKPQAMELSGQAYQVTVLPTTARPDLNKIAREPLVRYLRYLGVEATQVNTLADFIQSWRGDAERTLSAGDAEAWYASREFPYVQRSRPIEDWSELYYLKEATPDLVEFLRRHFTLHGESRLDVHYVKPGAIAALTGLPLDVVTLAVDQLLHPSERDKDRSLGDLVGVQNAAIIGATIETSAKADIPVIVTVEGPKLSATVVYDRKEHRIVEQLE
jgi:hypothetical protein